MIRFFLLTNPSTRGCNTQVYPPHHTQKSASLLCFVSCFLLRTCNFLCVESNLLRLHVFPSDFLVDHHLTLCSELDLR
ncbi:hypothetical protein RvY_02918 [Ramazzottius varieornatus]|uniref:Uncharacterized protein n=1 Tax=Ramazzottius varieornatus TaxID=947166 RepID=A0A1D1US24_RAMVA|nr:hypothetical protein RvY_02918 [Ramazzottius varieornatus]